VKFELIEAEKASFPVSFMCKQLGVSTSGFHAWRKRPPSSRALEDGALLNAIQKIHAKSKGRYGSPRVHRELVANGVVVSKHRIARLMRENGLRGRRAAKFKHTTDSNHAMPIAPNTLARDFTADAPNEAWVTDITYIPTREGWLYLAAILDLYSRRVVGWSMSERITRQLTLDALAMAIVARTPEAGLLHHSDRGSQYASADYQAALDAAGIECSMSRKGDCWDNAVAESFFATLKTELVHDADWITRAEARSAIFEYLEVFYNRQRRHSSIGYVSPEEFEMRYEDEKMAA
jgi:transposase InsO family protein